MNWPSVRTFLEELRDGGVRRVRGEGAGHAQQRGRGGQHPPAAVMDGASALVRATYRLEGDGFLPSRP